MPRRSRPTTLFEITCGLAYEVLRDAGHDWVRAERPSATREDVLVHLRTVDVDSFALPAATIAGIIERAADRVVHVRDGFKARGERA